MSDEGFSMRVDLVIASRRQKGLAKLTTNQTKAELEELKELKEMLSAKGLETAHARLLALTAKHGILEQEERQAELTMAGGSGIKRDENGSDTSNP